MTARTRKAGLLLVLLTFAAWAYRPLLGGGFVQDDIGVLLGASRVAFSPGFELGDLYTVPGSEGRPLAGLSMLLSAWSWGGGLEHESALWAPVDMTFLRLENLVLVLLAAGGILHAVRRGLEPWTGPEHARAAGRACGLFLAVNPLVAASVLRFDSRGEVLAAALVLGAAALFLRGRQERHYIMTGLAGLLAVLSGLASPIALFLPPVLAVLEYCSARRHRPRAVRTRTAITTFIVFGLCVALERIPRTLVFPDAAALAVGPTPLGEQADGLLGTIVIGVEKLGVLLLPVRGGGMGALGYVAAALAALICLHPAFVAARAAPRLWGRLLFGWLAALTLAQLPDAGVRVEPQTFSNAERLLAAAVAMSTGLGMGATALSGLRRLVLPLLAAICFAQLTSSSIGPVERAGEAQERLQVALLEAAAARGNRARLVVLDPPLLVDGVPVQRGPMSELVDPMFLPRGARSSVAIEARGVASEALRVLVSEPEFALLRGEGMVLVVDPARVPGFESFEDEAPWLALDVPRAEPPRGKRLMWRSEGSSPPDLQLDSLGQRAVVVQGLPNTGTSRPPELRWNASSERVPYGEVQGAWIQDDAGPMAVFDLGEDLTWLLGHRIKSLWFVDTLSSLASAEVLDELPGFEGEVAPLQRGADWTFDLGELPVPEPLEGSGSWTLGILDLQTYSHRAFPVEGEAVGGLRVPGVARHVASLMARGRGPIVWYLERRVADVAVARTRGRISR